MPNYRGLDVLRYECKLLTGLNIADEKEISLLEKEQKFISCDSITSHIELLQSFIENRKEKQEKYNRKLEEFTNLHVPTDSVISWDALEFLYQEYIPCCIPYLLRENEKRYDMRRNSLLANGIVSLQRTARKIATYDLYHNLVGSIVREHLLNEQIKELRGLPEFLRSSLFDTYTEAIQEKYAYFEERLQCCPEIGNMLYELQKLH